MPTEKAPRLCVQCSHCALQVHTYVCQRTAGVTTDLVTGQPITLYPRPCTFERSGQGECGIAGTHWAEKSPR